MAPALKKPLFIGGLFTVAALGGVLTSNVFAALDTYAVTDTTTTAETTEATSTDSSSSGSGASQTEADANCDGGVNTDTSS